MSTSELKKKLRSEGFEIYRTLGGRVVLAERVRDNLIMDSGVAAGPSDSDGFSVQVRVRAQASHFPGAGDDDVLGHAERLAAEFEGRGYSKGTASRSEMKDPSDPERSLDTSFEIPLQRAVESLDSLLTELRSVLAERRYTGDD